VLAPTCLAQRAYAPAQGHSRRRRFQPQLKSLAPQFDAAGAQEGADSRNSFLAGPTCVAAARGLGIFLFRGRGLGFRVSSENGVQCLGFRVFSEVGVSTKGPAGRFALRIIHLNPKPKSCGRRCEGHTQTNGKSEERREGRYATDLNDSTCGVRED
jgi:hypothetical protein